MIAGRDEQIVVLDGHRAIGHVDMDVGVQLLDFLGLRRGSTVGEDQSVAGELVITRAIAEVSAIAQTGGAVRLGGIDRLIDEVPDEAALIVRVALQCRVFVQIADRVAHCVHVLAGDVRFLRIMRETLVVGMGRRAVDLEHSRGRSAMSRMRAQHDCCLSCFLLSFITSL